MARAGRVFLSVIASGVLTDGLLRRSRLGTILGTQELSLPPALAGDFFLNAAVALFFYFRLFFFGPEIQVSRESPRHREKGRILRPVLTVCF